MGWNTEQVEMVLVNPNGQTGTNENTYVLWKMLQGIAKELPATETFLLSVAKTSKRYGNLTPKQAEYVAKGLGRYVPALVALSNAPKKALESPTSPAIPLSCKIALGDSINALTKLKRPLEKLMGIEVPSGRKVRKIAKGIEKRTAEAKSKAFLRKQEAAFLDLLENFEERVPA